MREIIGSALREAGKVLEQFNSADYLDRLEQAARIVSTCLANGGRVLACGNGGSMADAMHFAEELTGRFRRDRRPYAALALSDPSHLTCVANDYGFEFVFSRMVEAFGKDGDVLLALSTSGTSANLLRAAEKAKSLGMFVIAFVGRGGGPLATLSDLVIDAPGITSDRIQELHMLALHAIIEAIEQELGHGAD